VGQFEKHDPAAAKAAIDFEAFTARLKPGPFKTNLKLTHYRAASLIDPLVAKVL
jgi:hypothetical protein